MLSLEGRAFELELRSARLRVRHRQDITPGVSAVGQLKYATWLDQKFVNSHGPCPPSLRLACGDIAVRSISRWRTWACFAPLPKPSQSAFGKRAFSFQARCL